MSLIILRYFLWSNNQTKVVNHVLLSCLDLKLISSNGYWSLRSLVIKLTNYDEKKEPKRQFREVIVSFFIGRKPMFFVLFTLVPCMIIGMLILVSFAIPAESGERIGLCATILLAVSVYLLVITDQLPEQSDTLPLIGVYYIVIMFEIGLALAATVLVLMVHHATSKPPKLLTYLTGKYTLWMEIFEMTHILKIIVRSLCFNTN